MSFIIGFLIGLFVPSGKREGSYSPQIDHFFGRQQNYQNLADQFQAQQMQVNQQLPSTDKGPQ